MPNDIIGYHLKAIPKGVYGEVSKIREELEELEDAEEQGIRVMAMCELADLYGAIQAVALSYNLTMADLKAMSDVTKRAFESGARK